nr:Protodermal factor 1 like [Ipomoea batatas]
MNNFLLLLLLVAFLYCSGAEAATPTAKQQRRPGFLFTRNRGRCTPQYWSSRREAWPRMVPEMSTVSKVFGSRAYERYRYDLTLLEAASRNDDGDDVFASLVKESTAALLNSYARKPHFPFTAWEVKTRLIQALVSKDAAAKQAQSFADANQACN